MYSSRLLTRATFLISETSDKPFTAERVQDGGKNRVSGSIRPKMYRFEARQRFAPVIWPKNRLQKPLDAFHQYLHVTRFSRIDRCSQVEWLNIQINVENEEKSKRQHNFMKKESETLCFTFSDHLLLAEWRKPPNCPRASPPPQTDNPLEYIFFPPRNTCS